MWTQWKKLSVTSLFVGWWSWCMLTQEVLHWYHARSCRDHFEHSSDAWHSRETCLLSFRLTAADVFLSAIQSVVLLVSVLVVESSTGVDKEVMMHPLTAWQERKKTKTVHCVIECSMGQLQRNAAISFLFSFSKVESNSVCNHWVSHTSD